MDFAKKYGPWAIVAGAAEGLGEAYSEALAKRNLNIVMVDNQSDLLEKLSKRLEKDYHIETIQLNLDLSGRSSTEKILNASKNLDAGLLVYNAAYSLIKPFIEHSEEELDSFLEINSRTQLHLVHVFANRLIDQKRSGGILMMSSLAGLLGMQLVSTYAATKAFTWNLAEALHHEFKPHNIDIMACLAGVTDTPALRKSNPKFRFPKPQVMKPETVAETALNNLGKKYRHIPGFSNRLNYFILTRLMPRKLASSFANKTMGKMYK